MERIYKQSRESLIEFKTDGENLGVNYRGEVLINPFAINPTGEQSFNRVRGGNMKVKSIVDPSDVQTEFENNHRVEFELKNYHIKKRTIEYSVDYLKLTDKVLGPNKASKFLWAFPIEHDFRIVKKTDNVFVVEIGDVMVEIRPNVSVEILNREHELGFRKTLYSREEIDVSFEFRFSSPTRVSKSNVSPVEIKVGKDKLRYSYEQTGRNTLDVVLVPMPFTDLDFEMLADDEFKACQFHIPYPEIMQKRDTDKLYIFDSFNDHPGFFLSDFKKTSKMIRNLADKFRRKDGVVNLIAFDSTSMAAYKMSKFDIFDNILIVNPVIDIDVLYPESHSIIEKYINLQEYAEIAEQFTKDLANPRIRFLVSPYTRGYYDFIRAVEHKGVVKYHKVKLDLIRSTSEQDDYDQFALKLRMLNVRN